MLLRSIIIVAAFISGLSYCFAEDFIGRSILDGVRSADQNGQFRYVDPFHVDETGEDSYIIEGDDCAAGSALGAGFPCSTTLYLDDDDLYACDPRAVCGPRVGPIPWPKPGPVPKKFTLDEIGLGRVQPFRSSSHEDEEQFIDQHYQYVVALLDADGRVRCSGVIVNTKTILTAAHCICSDDSALGGGRRNIVTAYIGSDIYEETGRSQTLDITGSQVFSRYCDGGDVLAVDLAKLSYTSKDPVDPWFFADFSASFELPVKAVVVGWGTNDDSLAGGDKRSAGVAISPCAPNDGTGCRPEVEVIAITPSGSFEDSCNGDSGGPVVLGGVIIAVTSRGLANAKSEYCGEGGVYVSMMPGSNKRYEEIMLWLLR